MKANWNKRICQGRLIIRRDSTTDGRVSLETYSREAIVVDSRKYPMFSEPHGIAKDRNTTEQTGLEWCGYAAFDGEIYILDTAQRYIGSLCDSEKEDGLLYRRSSDRIKSQRACA